MLKTNSRNLAIIYIFFHFWQSKLKTFKNQFIFYFEFHIFEKFCEYKNKAAFE